MMKKLTLLLIGFIAVSSFAQTTNLTGLPGDDLIFYEDMRYYKLHPATPVSGYSTKVTTTTINPGGNATIPATGLGAGQVGYTRPATNYPAGDVLDNLSAKLTSNDGSSNHATDIWLVVESIDLSTYDGGSKYFTFSTRSSFREDGGTNIDDDNTIMYSTNFVTGTDPTAGATWTSITSTPVASSAAMGADGVWTTQSVDLSSITCGTQFAIAIRRQTSATGPTGGVYNGASNRNGTFWMSDLAYTGSVPVIPLIDVSEGDFSALNSSSTGQTSIFDTPTASILNTNFTNNTSAWASVLTTTTSVPRLAQSLLPVNEGYKFEVSGIYNPIQVSAVRFKLANGHSSKGSPGDSTWKVEASNDDITWNTVSDVITAIPAIHQVETTVLLTTSQAYRYYRFVLAAPWTSSNQYTALQQLDFTVGIINTWSGVDSDWTNTANWSKGTVPTTTDIAQIPSSAPNMPVIAASTSVTMNRVLVGSGASLTVSPKGIVTNNGTIANFGGSVTFQSDATGSAYIDNGTGKFAGDFTVERYIPARRAFRLLSAPVTTDNFIAGNWQLGTHITGSIGGLNGFDASASGNSSMFTFNNVAGDWNYSGISNTDATDLKPGTPYRILVRGDRTIDLANNAAPATVTTLSATGILTTENKAPNALTLNETVDGFSMIGNPFQSPVDMNTILGSATNVKSTTYTIWDPTLNTRGAYATITVATGTATAGSGNEFLQAGQAAFVQTIAAGAASLTFTQGSKDTTGSETATFKSSTKKSNVSQLRLSLYENSALAANESVADGLLILFDADFSNDVNYYDASKLTNLDENFATSNGGKLLSIEQRAIPTVSDEIPLNITEYRSTDYTIVVEGTSLNGETAFLFDAYTNESTEIPQNGSVNYSFSINTNIPASTTEDRFSVKFSSQSLSIPELEIEKIHLYPNPASTGVFYLHVPQDIDDLELTVYNVIGAKLYTRSGFKAGDKATINTDFAKEQGVYFVKLTSKGNSITKKLIIN